MICDPPPPPANTPGAESGAPRGQRAALPLAEIRSVEILWQGGLAFEADTPWPEASYRWTASGGELVDGGAQVEWQPPDSPGRYLLQVVTDWGAMGLAVDSLVLDVQADGSVLIG